MEIYRITNNLNGMIYIGQTRRTVAERVKQHLYQQSKIGKAMSKYGTENFSIDVIDHADTQEELDSLGAAPTRRTIRPSCMPMASGVASRPRTIAWPC